MASITASPRHRTRGLHRLEGRGSNKLTEHMALEWSAGGVRVNAVRPA